MGYEPPFERTSTIDTLCMEIAELVGMLHPSSGLGTSPVLHRELRIRTIRSSLMIEGNTLSEEAVTAIMDGKRVLGPARDILEVENAKRAYELIDSLDPLSLDDLLRVHRVMMDGLIEHAGCFRSGNVGVFDGETLIHAGTPANYVPQVMSDLFEWLAKTDLHPLLVSCVFHYEFEFIHPFADGNGRTGRLWHTLLLSRWRPALVWLPVEKRHSPSGSMVLPGAGGVQCRRLLGSASSRSCFRSFATRCCPSRCRRPRVKAALDRPLRTSRLTPRGRSRSSLLFSAAPSAPQSALWRASARRVSSDARVPHEAARGSLAGSEP